MSTLLSMEYPWRSRSSTGLQPWSKRVQTPVVNLLPLQSKGLKPPYHPNYGLHSIIAVLLKGRIWHRGWYAIKQKKMLTRHCLEEPESIFDND